MQRQAIWTKIIEERERQEQMWADSHRWGRGSCASGEVAEITKVAVLAEECGEVAQAVLKDDRANLRTELVQVAAVAVAWLESFDDA